MRGLVIALVAALSLEAAAQETTPAPPADEAGVDITRYPVGARDTLAVEVYEEKSLCGSFVVGDDGTVDLPLLGRVPVVGLTQAEVDDRLTELLARDFLVSPQVTVRVETFNSKPVQVLGGVAKPGTFYLNGPMDLLEILTLAGGLKDLTAVEVRVQRKRNPHEPEVVNLEQLVAYGTGNLALEPGDVIYVPPGPVVFVDGQVNKPGTVAFLDGLTAVEAINKAGGASPRANLRKVYILRSGVRTRVNAVRVLKGRIPDVVLQPEDHVYVNESSI